MTRILLVLCVIVFISCASETARILAVYPTPSISHQVVFRPLSLELAKRGHEVTVITTDPIFPQGNAPPNLTEIDVHDISYGVWKKMLIEMENRLENSQFVILMKKMVSIMEAQMETEAVQKILKDKTKKFDLIIVEAFLESALGLGYKYNAPVIQFSSLSSSSFPFQIFGAATHPLIFPTPLHKRVYNLTLWQKLSNLYDEYNLYKMYEETDKFSLEVMKRLYGPDVPTMDELRKNVDLLFLNVHPMWDFNRPVPPNVIYLGGMHVKPAKELPQDLKTYLDSSKNGVIYVSFGSNVDPTMFPPERIQILVNVFSKLPYDILWKWNQDELPGRTPNIRNSKWLPQSDLLAHPKLKLFITQCGLQSTDEAITAGVPLLGMPVFGDQHFNAEQYVYHGIGITVDIETVTEETLSKGINKILQDDSYRHNVVRLRELMRDQPQTPLERAVWWTEHTIKHSGASHHRARSANMSLAEYYELELVAYILVAIVIAVVLIVSVIRSVNRQFNAIKRKLKES